MTTPLLPEVIVLGTGPGLGRGQAATGAVRMELTAAAVAARRAAASIGASGGADFAVLVAQGPTPFQQLLKKPLTIVKPLEEVVKTATRISPRVMSAAARFNLGTALGQIGGYLASAIMDDLSQARLDQSMAEFQAVGVRIKPDSPLKTIDPVEEVLDEVIKTETRLSTAAPKMSRIDLGLYSFEFNPLFAAAPKTPKFLPQSISRPQVVSWKTPKLRTIPAFQRDETKRQLPTGFSSPFQHLVQRPVTVRAPDQMLPDLTGFDTRVLGSPQQKPKPYPRTKTERAGSCPPCPKKTRKEKKRTECWRKLVKEGITPSRDTEYRWTRIDCKTKKEL